MTDRSERDEVLFTGAACLHFNAACGCGHAVRLHLVNLSLGCRMCACPRLHDCPDVDAECERLVAERVARVLNPPSENGETFFHLSASSNQTFGFGFSGFKLNKATIVSSRYTPGKTRQTAYDDFHAPGLIHAPAVERLDTPTIDTSWGANRAALRAYLKPRIVEPEIARRNRSAVDRLFPLLTLDREGSTSIQGWWIRGHQDVHNLIQPADAFPRFTPQLLNWSFVIESEVA